MNNGFIDQMIAWGEEFLLSLIKRMGPFFVAALPATFTGYSIYASFHKEAGSEVAFIFALVVAIGIEASGIYLGHTAVRINNAFSWFLTVIYLIAVCGIVLMGYEAFTGLTFGIGLCSPFLVLSVYVAHALNLQKQEELHQTESEAKHEQQRQEQVEDEKRAITNTLRLERERAKIMSRYGVQMDGGNVQIGHQSDVLDTYNAQRQMTKTQRMDTLLDIYLDNPNAGVGEIMHQLGVNSRQTIYNYQDELQAAGRLRKNGHGWIVVEE